MGRIWILLGLIFQLLEGKKILAPYPTIEVCKNLPCHFDLGESERFYFHDNLHVDRIVIFDGYIQGYKIRDKELLPPEFVLAGGVDFMEELGDPGFLADRSRPASKIHSPFNLDHWPRSSRPQPSFHLQWLHQRRLES